MKEILKYEDYLPDGLTFEKLLAIVNEKPEELTLENLKKVVSEKALNMSEEDLLKFLKDNGIENVPLNLLTNNTLTRNFAYVEGLEKPEYLNQDFPEVKEEEEK